MWRMPSKSPHRHRHHHQRSSTDASMTTASSRQAWIRRQQTLFHGYHEQLNTSNIVRSGVRTQWGVSSDSANLPARTHFSKPDFPAPLQLQSKAGPVIQKSEEVIEVLSPPRMTAAVEDGQQAGQLSPASRQQLQPRAVILGFVRSVQSSTDDFSPSSASSSHRSSATLFRGEKDHGLDRALGECNTIRNRGSELDQGLLLRCMDRGALYPFMHYTIYRGVRRGGGVGEESVRAGAGIMQGRLRQLIAELKASPTTDFASYEELYAIQKSVSSASSSAGDPAGSSLILSSGRHSGYIVSFFKLLDQSYRQVELERTWLSWTGAREIYKYSPRNWNLRRITLHKHYTGGASTSSPSPASSFAYVLICEFNNILHPSNMLQAMDMCERLRARNCGYIALYQVQYSYGGEEQVPSLQGSSGAGRPNSMAALQKHPPLHATSATHHVSPQKSATSTWSSPISQKVLPTPPKDPSPLTATAAVRRRELLRGYSQDVDSTHDALRRRGALLRMRDRSLGYEQQQPGVNDQRRGSTADGGVVLGQSYSPLHMPSAFYPAYTVEGPMHSSSGSLPQSSTPPKMRSAAPRSTRDFIPPSPLPSSYYPRAPPLMPNYPGSSSTGHGGAGQDGPLMDYYE